MYTYVGVQVFDYFNPEYMNRCLHHIEVVTILKTLQLCSSTLISLYFSCSRKPCLTLLFRVHVFCLQPLILLQGKIKVPSPSISVFLDRQ